MSDAGGAATGSVTAGAGTSNASAMEMSNGQGQGQEGAGRAVGHEMAKADSGQDLSKTRMPGDPSGQETQGGETKAEKAARELGEQDLDALVTVKINGETKKMPLKEVIKLNQLEQASHEKMRRAAQMEKEIREAIAQLKSNPDALAELGVDVDSWAEERLARKYQLAQMSPEQRELHEARQQLERYQQAEMSSKKEVIQGIKEMLGADAPEGLEQYPVEQLQQYLDHQRMIYTQAEQQLNQQVAQAWRETGLPEDPYFGARMAHEMLRHQKTKGEALKPQDAAAKVKAGFSRNVREMLGKMDAPAIHELLGKEIVEKLRTFDVERVTGKPASKPQDLMQRPGDMPASRVNQPKVLNEVEWRKVMGLS